MLQQLFGTVGAQAASIAAQEIGAFEDFAPDRCTKAFHFSQAAVPCRDLGLGEAREAELLGKLCDCAWLQPRDAEQLK